MKRSILFYTLLVNISCVSDTGAIFVTEKQTESEDTADEVVVNECLTPEELKVSKSCGEIKLERDVNFEECRSVYQQGQEEIIQEYNGTCEEDEECMARLYALEEEWLECKTSKCIPDFDAVLEDSFCQDDCGWQSDNNGQDCAQCMIRTDPYGYQAYWLVIMESCICSHEDGSQICDENCDAENYIPEEITNECQNDFFSNLDYQSYIESCYISDFATECANNLLCQTFWESFQTCQQYSSQ